MPTWTIHGNVSFRFRPCINSAIPQYGGLDVEASQDFEAAALAVELLDTSADARRWLPDLLAGFEEFQAERSREGRPIAAVRLKIKKVHSHPFDTHSSLMKRVARDALRHLLERHGCEVVPRPTISPSRA